MSYISKITSHGRNHEQKPYDRPKKSFFDQLKDIGNIFVPSFVQRETKTTESAEEAQSSPDVGGAVVPSQGQTEFTERPLSSDQVQIEVGGYVAQFERSVINASDVGTTASDITTIVSRPSRPGNQLTVSFTDTNVAVPSPRQTTFSIETPSRSTHNGGLWTNVGLSRTGMLAGGTPAVSVSVIRSTPGSLGRKFNVSVMSSPALKQLQQQPAVLSSQPSPRYQSPYYTGRTMYGGRAGQCRWTDSSPYKTVSMNRVPVNVSNSNVTSVNSGVSSATAKRILETLENERTKRMKYNDSPLSFDMAPPTSYLRQTAGISTEHRSLPPVRERIVPTISIINKSRSAFGRPSKLRSDRPQKFAASSSSCPMNVKHVSGETSRDSRGGGGGKMKHAKVYSNGREHAKKQNEERHEEYVLPKAAVGLPYLSSVGANTLLGQTSTTVAVVTNTSKFQFCRPPRVSCRENYNLAPISPESFTFSAPVNVNSSGSRSSAPATSANITSLFTSSSATKLNGTSLPQFTRSTAAVCATSFSPTTVAKSGASGSRRSLASTVLKQGSVMDILSPSQSTTAFTTTDTVCTTVGDVVHLSSMSAVTSSVGVTSAALPPLSAMFAMPSDKWKCNVCELLNDLSANVCTVCAASRPASADAAPATVTKSDVATFASSMKTVTTSVPAISQTLGFPSSGGFSVTGGFAFGSSSPVTTSSSASVATGTNMNGDFGFGAQPKSMTSAVTASSPDTSGRLKFSSAASTVTVSVSSQLSESVAASSVPSFSAFTSCFANTSGFTTPSAVTNQQASLPSTTSNDTMNVNSSCSPTITSSFSPSVSGMSSSTSWLDTTVKLAPSTQSPPPSTQSAATSSGFPTIPAFNVSTASTIAASELLTGFSAPSAGVAKTNASLFGASGAVTTTSSLFAFGQPISTVSNSARGLGVAADKSSQQKTLFNSAGSSSTPAPTSLTTSAPAVPTLSQLPNSLTAIPVTTSQPVPSVLSGTYFKPSTPLFGSATDTTSSGLLSSATGATSSQLSTTCTPTPLVFGSTTTSAYTGPSMFTGFGVPAVSSIVTVGGQTSTTSSATLAPFSFGSTSGSQPTFGAQSASTAQSVPSFGGTSTLNVFAVPSTTAPISTATVTTQSGFGTFGPFSSTAVNQASVSSAGPFGGFPSGIPVKSSATSIFGQPSSVVSTPQSSVFGTATFGQSTSTAPAAFPTPAFGNSFVPSTSAPSFGFGNTQSNFQASAPAFGAPPVTSSSSSSTPFSFNMASGNSSGMTQQFSFKPAVSMTTTSSTSLFTHGKRSDMSADGENSIKRKVPNFGSSAGNSGFSSQPQFAFGGGANQSAPAFTGNNQQATTAFGGNASVPTFGGNSQPFGGNSQATNIFGASNPNPMGFGASNPGIPTFGASTPAFGNAVQETPRFGGNTQPALPTAAPTPFSAQPSGSFSLTPNFQFGQQSATAAPFQFSAQQGSTPADGASRGRTIKRATRRLQRN